VASRPMILRQSKQAAGPYLACARRGLRAERLRRVLAEARATAHLLAGQRVLIVHLLRSQASSQARRSVLLARAREVAVPRALLSVAA
jgi:hypothetical protein